MCVQYTMFNWKYIYILEFYIYIYILELYIYEYVCVCMFSILLIIFEFLKIIWN